MYLKSMNLILGSIRCIWKNNKSHLNRLDRMKILQMISNYKRQENLVSKRKLISVSRTNLC